MSLDISSYQYRECEEESTIFVTMSLLLQQHRSYDSLFNILPHDVFDLICDTYVAALITCMTKYRKFVVF